MPVENNNLYYMNTQSLNTTPAATTVYNSDNNTYSDSNYTNLSHPQTDTFTKQNTPEKKTLSTEQKGLIAAGVALLGSAILFLATRGKGKKNLEKSSTEVIDKVADNETKNIKDKVGKDLKLKAEQEAKAKAEQEAKAKAEQELKAKAGQEAKAKAEQEAKTKAEQEAKAKAEQEAKAKAEQEAKAKAEQEAKAKAEQEAKAKAEQEAKAKAEQEAKAKAEQEAKAKAEQELKAKVEQEANKILTDPKKRAVLEDIFKNEKINKCKSKTDCTQITETIDEAINRTIKGEFKDVPEYIYHGTKKENYENIMKNGFDISKCRRGDSGQGVYFGFDEAAVKDKYGQNVVKAKYLGKKVAQVEPSVIGELSNYGTVRSLFADKLGLEYGTDKSDEIIDNLINKRFKSKLNEQGYEAVYAPHSHQAGCGYIAVFDPKNIQIIK